MRICQSCRDMAKEEGGDSGVSATQICIEAGAEIADHTCEQTDTGRLCACACH